MSKLNKSVLAGLATSLLYAAPSAWADDDRNQFRARLIGYEEVAEPGSGAVSSTGRGQFRARARGDQAIDWELTYERLEGAITTQAHVHFGQKHTQGGISFFLCGPPASARMTCTPREGRFTGTATAADIIGPTGQGIAPTEIAEVIKAMRAGVTYANVHTDKHPSGEIRGQIRGGNDDEED